MAGHNHFYDSEVPKLSRYWCVVAQSYSDKRQTRQRKLMRDPGLCDQVERCCLRSGWTPISYVSHLDKINSSSVRMAGAKIGTRETSVAAHPKYSSQQFCPIGPRL